VRRRHLVHQFGGGIAQHVLGTRTEQLNDALLVGRYQREAGAVENRALQ